MSSTRTLISSGCSWASSVLPLDWLLTCSGVGDSNVPAGSVWLSAGLAWQIPSCLRVVPCGPDGSPLLRPTIPGQLIGWIPSTDVGKHSDVHKLFTPAMPRRSGNCCWGRRCVPPSRLLCCHLEVPAEGLWLANQSLQLHGG